MKCPQCGATCDRDEVDNGAGTEGGPWGRPECHWVGGEGSATLTPDLLSFFGEGVPAAELEGFARVARALRRGVTFAYQNAIPCLAVAGAAADTFLFAALHLIREARAQKGEAGEAQAREAVAGLLTLVSQQIQETGLVRLAPGPDRVQ